MTKDFWQWLIHYTIIMLDFVVCELHFQNPGMEVKYTPFLSWLAYTDFCNISVKTVMQTHWYNLQLQVVFLFHWLI